MENWIYFWIFLLFCSTGLIVFLCGTILNMIIHKLFNIWKGYPLLIVFIFLTFLWYCLFFFYPKTYVFHVRTSSIVTCRITLWVSSYRFWIFLLSLHIFFICFCNLEPVHHLLALVCCLYEGYWLLCIGFITQHFVKFSYYSGFWIIILKFPDVQSCCSLIGMVLILPFKFLHFYLFSLVYIHCLISLL